MVFVIFLTNFGSLFDKFGKGGLISQSFSLWLKFPKMGAKVENFLDLATFRRNEKKRFGNQCSIYLVL